jgi:hypothetical protein
MELNAQTFGRVAALVTLPSTTVQYNGVWPDGSVCFLVGSTNDFDSWIYGIALYVTQDFKIKKVERIRTIQSTGQRKRPIEWVTVPIYAEPKVKVN